MKLAKFVYNNGLLALLCSTCNKIIKVDKDFNLGEMRACHGKATLNPQYCEECKNKKL